jgi:hypothetical protein
MFVSPLTVGAGNRFLPDQPNLNLRLLDERRFANGVVYLQYQVSPGCRGAGRPPLLFQGVRSEGGTQTALVDPLTTRGATPLLRPHGEPAADLRLGLTADRFRRHAGVERKGYGDPQAAARAWVC